MHTFILNFHSYTRWAIFILLLILVWKTFQAKKNPQDVNVNPLKKMGLVLTILADLNLLFGIYLYVQLWDAAKANDANIMADVYFRKRLVEHAPLMIISIIMMHIGGIMLKKNIDADKKYKKAFMFYLIALIAILLGVPSWRF